MRTLISSVFKCLHILLLRFASSRASSTVWSQQWVNTGHSWGAQAPPNRSAVHAIKWLNVSPSAVTPLLYVFGGKDAPGLCEVKTQSSLRSHLRLILSFIISLKCLNSPTPKRSRNWHGTLKTMGCVAINCRRLETELISAAKTTTVNIYFDKIPISQGAFDSWELQVSIKFLSVARRRLVELLLGINLFVIYLLFPTPIPEPNAQAFLGEYFLNWKNEWSSTSFGSGPHCPGSNHGSATATCILVPDPPHAQERWLCPPCRAGGGRVN